MIKKLGLILTLLVLLPVLVIGSEIWFRGFDLSSVSMDEVIKRESAELKSVEQGIKEIIHSDAHPTSPIKGLTIPLDIDKVTFETSILILPVELEYNFYNGEIFCVKYRFYGGKITSHSHNKIAFDALAYHLQEKYGPPTYVGDETVRFKQGDLFVVLEKLPSSMKFEISYIVIPFTERIIESKFQEIVFELFGTTLVDVGDIF